MLYTPSFSQLSSVVKGLICRAYCSLYMSGKPEHWKNWDSFTPIMFQINMLFLNSAAAPLSHLLQMALYSITLPLNLLLFQIWWKISTKHPRMRLTRGNLTPRSVKSLTGPCGAQDVFLSISWGGKIKVKSTWEDGLSVSFWLWAFCNMCNTWMKYLHTSKWIIFE